VAGARLQRVAEPVVDVSVDVGDDFVATVEVHRPPNNFIDVALAAALADAYERLDDDPACRAIVLCSEGKHFCAGAALGANAADPEGELQAGSVYRQAVRMFSCGVPVVAAFRGPRSAAVWGWRCLPISGL
jgi:enoyl-CoA hydratase/carnithine racemase